MKNKENTPICSHEWDEPTCIFGCGSTVDTDTGICLICNDHSQNEVVCLKCDVVAQVDNFTGEISIDAR